MLKLKFKTAPLAAAVTLALSFSASTSFAETISQPDGADAPAGKKRDATQLEKVEVNGVHLSEPTSPKLPKPLLDTPQTITIIPNTVFTEQGQTSLRDVLRNTPGITVQAGEGGAAAGDNLFIRGFGARNDVYIDGVRDPGVVSRDTFNVQQVEVAKGPSSAVSGRGSAGGSINLVSKSAHLGDASSLRATVGNADYLRGTLDVNHQLNSSAALRLNLMWHDAGMAGRDEVKDRAWGFAPSLVLGLGGATQLTFNYQHVEQDNLPGMGLPVTLPPNVPTGFTPADLDWSNFYGLTQRDHEEIKSDVATIIVDHAISDSMSLRNLTRYGRNDRDGLYTPPRAATSPSHGSGYNPAVPQIRRTDLKSQDRVDDIFANQTSLSLEFGTGAITHHVVAGLELSREESISYARVDRNAALAPITDLYDPNPDDSYAMNVVRTGAYTEAKGDSLAAYLFDSVDLGERWQISGGARWERFDVDFTSVAAPVPPAASGIATQLSRVDDMLSWRAGVVYKPRANGSIFVGMGTSFTPSADGGQGLVLGTTGVNSDSLAPEKTHTIEVGTKWELFNNRLLASAALFKSEKTNARTKDVAGNILLAGNQEIQGIELTATGKITHAWSVFAGYAFMDSKITESATASEIDRELQYVPEHSANLWTSYEFKSGIVIGGGAQFTDGYFFTNTTPTPAAAILRSYTRYTLFNAMASFPLGEKIDLQLNANNLSDERYIERGNGGHFIPGAGRTILVSLDVQF